MMTTHPGQALGVSLTTSRGLPVLAVLSTTGMCCTAVHAACSCCGALGGASDCCVPQRRLHFTDAIPAASCCCIHCSQEISAGFFFISVGTRPAPTLYYSLIIVLHSADYCLQRRARLAVRGAGGRCKCFTATSLGCQSGRGRHHVAVLVDGFALSNCRWQPPCRTQVSWPTPDISCLIVFSV
jgi:hypothetical protein